MANEKHEPQGSRHPRRKRLSAAAAIFLLVLLAAGFSVRYLSFASWTIYQESTSHLEEVLHKSNNMLKEMVRKNLTYLHLYNGFLESTSDEDEIQAYIEAAQQNTGFADFYFLTYDGNYMTVTGETGYLGLQTNLDEKLAHDEDVVVNTALPGKPQMLAFICPETQGSYRGFAYDAIAISYYNDAVLRLLDNSAFEGNASNYVIYPDGRVVIDNSVNRKETIYNFLATLRDHSDLSEEQILALSDAFAQGSSGNLKVKLGDTSYYLVYEGTAVQNWTMVGLVPVSIVNASLDQLWFHTIQIVAGIAFGFAVLVILLIARRSHATLRRKDTEIRYRDVLFQKLSLNVDDVFLMLDAETYKVDYVSPNIGRLLGIPWRKVRQDVHALAALYPKEDLDRDKNFLEGLSRGEQREWDTAYLHQETREPRWFHVVAMGSEVEDKTKYILVMSDRTADKQVNQALSDAVAAAETANRAKSTFLSNMSHDIRTPMNAIIGITTLMKNELHEPEKLAEHLGKLETSGQLLLGIINNILDMSRIESGKTTLNVEKMNLPQQIRQLDSIIRQQAGQSRQTFTVSTHLQHENVLADPNRLNQVLMNILSNAVKYTPTGGHIQLEVDELPRNEHYARYRFVVQDDGIGMSADYQKTLFDPFTREERSGTNKVQGTGLGMAITKSIVDLMGGSINVESATGEGTRFEVVLEFPIDAEADHAQQVQALPEEAEETSPLSGMKFLCAEDNAINAEILQMLLETKGASCTICPNGQEIVDAFANVKPGEYDMILMDVQMPVMDGLEATRRIRNGENPLGRVIPILAMTANAFLEDMQKSREAGMDAHLSKPVDIAALEQTVKRFRVTPPQLNSGIARFRR